MSTISEALKKYKPVLLVECDFDGLIKRYAAQDVRVGDKLFKGDIISISEIGQTFNWSSFRYSASGVSVTVKNHDRLQDEESRRVLDGGTVKIYIWCEGLSWADIDPEGLMFEGSFRKNSHTKDVYSFTIADFVNSKFKTIPDSDINSTTWPDHATQADGTSYAGDAQPIIFGDWARGIPLMNIHTSDFDYLMMLGVAKSTDAEFTATTENVYDKDDAVIGAPNFTLEKVNDGENRPITRVGFTGDRTASEPMHCSMRGVYDPGTTYVPVAGDLIDHPAGIVHWIMDNYSTLTPAQKAIGSIKTIRSSFPGIKFATLINSRANAVDIIDRLFSHIKCARINQVGGGVGAVVFDTNAEPRARIVEETENAGPLSVFGKTSDALVCNNLTVKYKYNPTTRQYEGELHLDKDNNILCKSSYFEYGERPEKILTIPDINIESIATFAALRHLIFFSHRHDTITRSALYADGFDLNEGHMALITDANGTSRGGAGYVKEKFILMQKKYGANLIQQVWWRVRVNMDYGGTSALTGAYILDHLDEVILDHTGGGIIDHLS